MRKFLIKITYDIPDNFSIRSLIPVNPSDMEIEAENVSKAKEKVDYVKSLPVVSDCEYVEEIK